MADQGFDVNILRQTVALLIMNHALFHWWAYILHFCHFTLTSFIPRGSTGVLVLARLRTEAPVCLSVIPDSDSPP